MGFIVFPESHHGVLISHLYCPSPPQSTHITRFVGFVVFPGSHSGDRHMGRPSQPQSYPRMGYVRSLQTVLSPAVVLIVGKTVMVKVTRREIVHNRILLWFMPLPLAVRVLINRLIIVTTYRWGAYAA